MVALLMISGMMEGVGVVSMLPLLNLALGGMGGSDSTAADRWLDSALSWVGIEPSVGAILGIIVAAIALKSLLLWLAMRQVGFAVAGLTRDLRMDLMDALLKARWSYFGRTPIGRFVNSITTESERAANAYLDACVFLGGILQVIVYLAAALLISWRASLLAIVVGILFVFTLRGFVTMSRSAGEEQTRRAKALTSRLVDVLKGIKPVKAMAREEDFQPLFRHEVHGLYDAQRKRVVANETLPALFEPIVTVILAVGLFVTLTVASLQLSTAVVLAFVFYRIFRQINILQVRYLQVVGGESAFWSLRETYERAAIEAERETGLSGPTVLRDSIRFKSVTFGYDDAPVLTDVTLTIPAGAFVTFTGASGAGKTTLVDLLVGLHHPRGGSIHIDGRPMSDINLRDWRRSIGYVPQETMLFNDTILENVTLGHKHVTRQDVERALQAAGAWEFVEAKGGVDAEVGEGGEFFSGGQRQRIAIARALVGSPTLLILDEVTTALDPDTESEVCETLATLRGTATIVAISHQDALRKAADVVYTIDNGRVYEDTRDHGAATVHTTAQTP